MITRCRYTKQALQQLRKQQREGTFIRFMRSGAALVLWDGLKCQTAYHPDFIEVMHPIDDDPDLLEERVRPVDELRIRRA